MKTLTAMLVITTKSQRVRNLSMKRKRRIKRKLRSIRTLHLVKAMKVLMIKKEMARVRIIKVKMRRKKHQR